MSSTHCRFERSSCENRRKLTSESAAWLASASNSRRSDASIGLALRTRHKQPSRSPSAWPILTKTASDPGPAGNPAGDGSSARGRIEISRCGFRAASRIALRSSSANGSFSPPARFECSSTSVPVKTATAHQDAFNIRPARAENRWRKSGRFCAWAASSASCINSSARFAGIRTSARLPRPAGTEPLERAFALRIGVLEGPWVSAPSLNPSTLAGNLNLSQSN